MDFGVPNIDTEPYIHIVEEQRSSIAREQQAQVHCVHAAPFDHAAMKPRQCQQGASMQLPWYPRLKLKGVWINQPNILF